jgi:beta-mannosidase
MQETPPVATFLLDGDPAPAAGWLLYHFEEGAIPVTCPEDLTAAGLTPIPAAVPGNVELDLERAGQIPDPFYAANIMALRPLETHEWWYVREFVPPTLPTGAVGCDLVFEGLDALATVWLNGVEVGRADNMLIAHRFDVTAVLRPGETNTLAVRIGSAVNAAQRFRYDAASMSWEGREEGLFIRKAPHVWGWDIMPRAVSAGIWRSVYLEPRPPDAIEQLYFWTESVNAEGAVLGVRYQFRTAVRSLAPGLALRVRGVTEDGLHRFERLQPVEFFAGGFRVSAPGARLWWPHGYGDPVLYLVKVELLHDGQVIAETTERIGIRTVELQRTEVAAPPVAQRAAADGAARLDVPPDPAGHFRFVVNGEPIMVKGSNWVPLDAYHSRDAGRVAQALDLFADLGCNMVRCWGGNVYEDHAFFDRCDELGLLVWQDFAFACCRYPQTEDFLGQVRREAEAVVEKLRNHPSLALWCGDNEVDQAFISAGLSPEHNRLTREVLLQVAHRCDPFRTYIPSSPYISPAAAREPEPYAAAPEQHLWGPRGYYKGAFYTDHRAGFIGEIGYHGCPNVSSIRRFIAPDALWPWQDNPQWQAHAVYHWLSPETMQRDRIALMANQVRELFGEVPDDLQDFAFASQIVQAEAKKFFIEATRMRKWRTSGILWWNVLDGWPQFSDAVVDYYFGVKLAYHYIRRVQQPVAVMIGEPGPGKYLPVVVGNDSRADADVRFTVRDADSRATLAEGALRIPANQNWQVARIRAYASDQRLFLIEWESGDERFGNHYLIGSPPFSLARYRAWLPAIAALVRPFDAELIAR